MALRPGQECTAPLGYRVKVLERPRIQYRTTTVLVKWLDGPLADREARLEAKGLVPQ